MAASCEFVLLRHGIAEDASERGVPDADRQLTAKGRERTRQAAEGLLACLHEPVIVLHSPLVRARETAEIVAGIAGAPTVELAALAPGGAQPDLLAGLIAEADERTPIGVGHEPDLSSFVAAAVGGERAAGFEIKKAAACRLSVSGDQLGTATLHWLLPPRTLRALAQD